MTKKIILLLALCAALTLAALAFKINHQRNINTAQASKIDTSNQSVVATDALNILRQYLIWRDKNPADWTVSKNNMLSSQNNTTLDEHGKPIHFIDSIRIVVSNKNTKARKYAFLIERAHIKQPLNNFEADYPQQDSYTCEVLVLTAHHAGWLRETLDEAQTNEYDGDTRFAKTCDGYTITWKHHAPLFAREEVYGPYAGGMYSTVKEKLIKKAGKYQMQSDILSEGEFPN